jgi:Kef-type K+ transport system membrane component KefB
MARGEFSIVIASLGAAIEPDLSALAGTYVLITVLAGPILSRLIDRAEGPAVTLEMHPVPASANAEKVA